MTRTAALLGASLLALAPLTFAPAFAQTPAPISVTEPQPGKYAVMRRLQTRATSGIRQGLTTKRAPRLR